MHKSHSVRLARKARRRRHGAQAGSLSPGWREAPVKARVPQQRLWTTMRCERERVRRGEKPRQARSAPASARKPQRRQAKGAPPRSASPQQRNAVPREARSVQSASVTTAAAQEGVPPLGASASVQSSEELAQRCQQARKRQAAATRERRAPTQGKSPKEEHDACASDSASVTARVSQQRLCTRDTPTRSASASVNCDRDVMAADLQIGGSKERATGVRSECQPSHDGNRAVSAKGTPPEENQGWRKVKP